MNRRGQVNAPHRLKRMILVRLLFINIRRYNMKSKKMNFFIVFMVVVIAGCNVYLSQSKKGSNTLDLVNITLLAYAESTDVSGEADAGGGYSCTVTSTCFGAGGVAGSVSCSGTVCERSSGGSLTSPWVKCDGKK